MHKHLAGVAVLVAALVPALSACPRGPADACTLVGCDDRLQLTFSEDVEVPYSAQLTLDDDEAFTVECTPSGLESSGTDLFASCDPAGIYIDGASPERVSVQLERDGQVLADTEVTPSYQELRPNGEGCPPVCQQGGAELAL